jgi:hypothetical protein
MTYVATQDEMAWSCDMYALEAQRRNCRYALMTAKGFVFTRHYQTANGSKLADTKTPILVFNADDEITVESNHVIGDGIGVHFTKAEFDSKLLVSDAPVTILRKDIPAPHNLVHVYAEGGKIHFKGTGYLYDSETDIWSVIESVDTYRPKAMVLLRYDVRGGDTVNYTRVTTTAPKRVTYPTNDWRTQKRRKGSRGSR